MEQENILILLQKYNAGKATDSDLLLMETLLEKGAISPEDLNDLSLLESKIDELETPSPSVDLDDRFYALLASEKGEQRRFRFADWFSLNTLGSRLAFGSVIFVLGLSIGYLAFHTGEKSTGDMVALSNEVRDLREMMMLSLLEKESATDRLKAVSLSQEFEQSSAAVTKALVKTLNNDVNVNVRLAALEALKPYAGKSEVRRELIQAIAKQDSPLVQIALAELMGSLQEKSSVKEFDKLLQDKKTPGEVKTRIRKSIEVLI